MSNVDDDLLLNIKGRTCLLCDLDVVRVSSRLINVVLSLLSSENTYVIENL